MVRARRHNLLRQDIINFKLFGLLSKTARTPLDLEIQQQFETMELVMLEIQQVFLKSANRIGGCKQLLETCTSNTVERSR